MKQIYLLKLSQDQSASIFLTQMLLNILNILGQSNALEKLICMVVISWSLAMALQMWPPNISHCPGFHIWTILQHWTNQSLFLIVKTEVRSIVLPHWPSIYIWQHNKEPFTCRTRGCRLAHGTMSPPCSGTCCQQKRASSLGHPSAKGCAQDSDSASGGGCAPVPLALQDDHREAAWSQLRVSAVGQTQNILIKRLGSQVRPRWARSFSVCLMQGLVFWVD